MRPYPLALWHQREADIFPHRARHRHSVLYTVSPVAAADRRLPQAPQATLVRRQVITADALHGDRPQATTLKSRSHRRRAPVPP
jgi:hypothetical protein